MINLIGKNKQQNIRAIADFVEPFVIKQLQKENHTFFIYRCSEYRSFTQLCQIHKFDSTKINKKIIETLNTYWSCIDAIHIHIEDMPYYSASKEYFDILYSFQEQNKKIASIECYEIKATSGTLKPILSVKTKEFAKSLERFALKLNVIHLVYKGYSTIRINKERFNTNNFYTKTHYGRRNITLKED